MRYILLCGLVCLSEVALRASVNADSTAVQLDLRTARVGGTLLLPKDGKPYPCVVLVGGTLSQRRDGELERPGVPERKAMLRLAESLSITGFGSFRYDQVGHGESKAKAGYVDLYRGDAEVLRDIYAYLRGRKECTKVIAVGESAGAYVASLAARSGAHADGYVFLGGFCGKAEEIFSYNHGRLAEYVERSAGNAAWAKANGLERYVAYGRRWKEMFAAALAGKQTYEVMDGGFRETAQLARRKEELDDPPDAMFAYVRNPALAVAGSRDRNVPPEHGACAVEAMRKAGNKQVQSVVIAEADHNFQIAPADEDVAIRERFTFASFRRPYHPQLDREVLAWLEEFFPVHGHHHEPEGPVRNTELEKTLYSRAVQGSEEDKQTAVSPPRFHLAPGVTIVEDILNKAKTPGVETLEGRIGPLLRTGEMRAHFIDMPAGLYLDEHPHTKGSIIYTVRGKWGLKSLGRWHLMKPGSLYWFGDNIPTGFQVPFGEDAFILIFKAAPGSEDGEFLRYLERLAGDLVRDQNAGTPFRLVDLPVDHPALRFAREVNPRFDAEVGSKR